MTNYYVYVLIDPRNNQPFYVGLGKNSRAESHLVTSPSKQRSNPHRFRKIKQIQDAGLQPIINKVCVFPDKAEAGEYEKELIQLYGRVCDGSGILTNIKPGGLGGKHIDNTDYTSNKPVDQYDRLGNFIQTFISAASAARTVGSKNPQAISQCCHKTGNAKTHKNYFWTFAGIPLDADWCWVKTKPVYQWDLTGHLVAKHVSSSAAARATNITRASIGECITGNVPRAGDFMWSYDPVPPVYVGKRRIVLCIETGQTFKSVGEAADVFLADRSSLAAACRNPGRRCKGYTFKYIG